MGGKWRLAPWIIGQFPPHRVYLEPYGGAASVLLRKPRARREIYNDLDGELVDLFRTLRDPEASKRLIAGVALTPFARAEFDLTYETSADPVEASRRLIARSFLSHGSTAVAKRRRTGFRANGLRSGSDPAWDWRNLPEGLAQIVDRLQGVVLENRPAVSLMRRFDRPETLIYVDPPYLHASRSQKRIHGTLAHSYKFEMEAADHAEMLAWLAGCRSMAIVSGYRSDLYDDALAGWRRLEHASRADGAAKRVEVLWINPAAIEARGLLSFEAA